MTQEGHNFLCPPLVGGGCDFLALARFRYLPMTQRRHYFLLHRTAAPELDPNSETPLREPRAFALELGNIAERPGALQAPLNKIIAGLPSHEHPAGRTLATVSFASFDLLKFRDLEAQSLGCASLSSELIAKFFGSCRCASPSLSLCSHRTCSGPRSREPRGLFSSHGSFRLVQRERPASRPRNSITKKYVPRRYSNA